jgi:hypothetical protein
VDPKARSPEHDDERAQSPPVHSVPGASHHGDDPCDRWRIGGVPLALVAGRTVGMESGHRRRRPTASGGIEQPFGHDASLEFGERLRLHVLRPRRTAARMESSSEADAQCRPALPPSPARPSPLKRGSEPGVRD